MLALLQEQGKELERLAKRFRHDISLIKNGVNTCFGLEGQAAISKYTASSAALLNHLDTKNELAEAAGVSLALAYDLYEAELKQNRYAHTAHTAHCTLHTAHCTLHTAHCTLHTAHCTLHTAHCCACMHGRGALGWGGVIWGVEVVGCHV